LSLGGLLGRGRSALLAVGGEPAKLKVDYLDFEQTETKSGGFLFILGHEGSDGLMNLGGCPILPVEVVNRTSGRAF